MKQWLLHNNQIHRGPSVTSYDLACIAGYRSLHDKHQKWCRCKTFNSSVEIVLCFLTGFNTGFTISTWWANFQRDCKQIVNKSKIYAIEPSLKLVEYNHILLQSCYHQVYSTYFHKFPMKITGIKMFWDFHHSIYSTKIVQRNLIIAYLICAKIMNNL